jgi:hypothetical protein
VIQTFMVLNKQFVVLCLFACTCAVRAIYAVPLISTALTLFLALFFGCPGGMVDLEA